MVLSEETIAAILAARAPPVPAQGSVEEHVVEIVDNQIEEPEGEVEALEVGDNNKEADLGTREEEQTYTCKKSAYCKKKLKSKAELDNHIREFHTEMGKKFSCTLCGKRFARKQQLTNHCKTHNKEIVKCEVCGKVKKDKLRLEIHMEQYHSTEVSICHRCRSTFKARIELRNHNKSCEKVMRKKQKQVDLISAASIETVTEQDSTTLGSVPQSSSESPTVVQRLNLSPLIPNSE